MMSKQTFKNKTQKQKRKNRTNYPSLQSARVNEIYSTAFPREMKVTLRYTEFLTSTSTTALNFDQVMNLNSIYDPNRTGAGHQPQGYDQWALFYNRYRVDGCKISSTWTNAPTAGSTVSILANNDATAILDPIVINESPLGYTKGMTAGGPAVTISRNYDLAQLTGVTRAVYNADDRYSAPFGSSPTEVLVAHVGSWDAASYTYSYHIQMWFYVTLFDPIQLGTS